MVGGCSETWWTLLSMLGIVPEVKLGDLMSGEEDVPDSIVSCRTNSHWHALECLRYLEDTAKELEPTFVVNTAYQVGWFVLQGWKDLGKQSLAHLVLGGRSSKVKGVMGPLQVVDVPPQVEGSLAVRQISEAAPLQHFNAHGSVEALIFSLCLRVIRASMTDSDAQPQQPDCKRCVGVVLVMAPRGAIVHQHCVGQAVAPEDSRQALLHHLSLLVTAGLQPQGKPRVIVQNSQRVAASSGKGEVAFEVHLPQVVGCLVFKSLPGTVLGPLGGVNAAMTTQDRRDR